MESERSKLLKRTEKQQGSTREQTRRRERDIDKEIKRVFRKNKRNILRRGIEKAIRPGNGLSPARLIRLIQKMTRQPLHTPNISPEDYTAYISYQQPHAEAVCTRNFTVPSGFTELIWQAIMTQIRLKGIFGFPRAPDHDILSGQNMVEVILRSSSMSQIVRRNVQVGYPRLAAIS